MTIFDVVKPKGAWARQYAKLEYEHIGLKMVGATKIPVVTKIEVIYE